MSTKELNLRVCLALDESSAKKIDRLAKKAGISRSSAMRELITAQAGELAIPEKRRRTYSPWNERVGRQKNG